MKNLNVTLITVLVIILLTGVQNISYAQKGSDFTTSINNHFVVKTQNFNYKILSLDGSKLNESQILIQFSKTNKTSKPSVVKQSSGASRSYSSRSYIVSTPHQTQVIPSYKYQAQTTTLDVGGLGRLVIDVASQLAK